ncbi:SUMF1/EgtB/PvdO family nonheme iron enzyme [Desulfococcaceae bacterium HSG9]|nr:SUMF1/EgtB/PvdO family nonheme iron enzyme [Desulfococcaceae bacterium HSG9]
MHVRFGSPTDKAPAGALEEFLLAYDDWKTTQKPHIMFYFKAPQPRNLEDINQLQKVFELKNRIEQDRLLLYTEFDSEDAFAAKFDKNMRDWIVSKRLSVASPTPVKTLPAVIPEEYKDWIVDTCGRMDLDNLMEKGRVIVVKLPKMFIPLYAHPPFSESEETEIDAQIIEAREKLADIEDLMVKHKYLLIQGDAGSGKTTLLKHFCYTMAHEPGWKNCDGYLPVLIFLKDIKRLFVKDAPPNAATAEKLLNRYFEDVQNGLSSDIVKSFCDTEKAVFLFDGLDEISSAIRKPLVKSLAAFRRMHKGCPMILSGRPHGVDSTVVNYFGDRHIKIEPLDRQQVETFITRWFGNVYGSRSKIGHRTALDMIGEINDHPGVERLIDNPLMLTAICILYHDGGELPGQRAELYKKFVNNLLCRRFDDPEKVHRFLMALALEMHTKHDKGMDRADAVKILQNVYAQWEPGRAPLGKQRAEAKFDHIEPRCGLMQHQSEHGRHGFHHLTFQEFLAATALIDRELDYQKAIEEYWGDPWYKEMAELYIGYLSIENRNQALNIVKNVLDGEDQTPFYRWRLAARSLLDIHPDKRDIDVNDLAAEKLRKIIVSQAEVKDRADAGEILGWLGDLRALDRFVEIEGGVYPLENGRIKIRPFEIGKYPVTNQQFKKFVAAGGYSDTAYWSPEGLKWLQHTQAKEPRYWRDRKSTCPNAPVVGVCWLEADAYMRWLTSNQNDGYTYRLPDENEWEAAAAGFEQRQYPWCKEWDSAKCNTEENKIGKTTSVGIFTQGETPQGVAELSGNVWEWTCSDYYSKKQ